MTPLDVVTSFMQKNNIPGVLLFAVVTGSVSYHLATEASDVDYIGVFDTVGYALPTRNILSLKEQVWNVSTLPHSDKPDCTLYEIQKYLELLYKGNPFMLESLFTKLTGKEYQYVHPLFTPIIDSRSEFITSASAEEFLSYIHKSIKRDEERAMKGKRKYHILRLLFETKRMLMQRDLKVYLDGWEQDVLVNVRSESMSKSEFKDMVDDYLRQVAELQTTSKLPDLSNAYTIADKFLLQIRKHCLQL